MQQHDELRDILAASGGYLFRRDLVRLGFSDKHIAGLVRAKTLRRVRHGTYVDASVFATLDEADRHRLLARSVLDRLGPEVAASHQTAALLLGLDTYGLPLDKIHVIRLDPNKGKTEADVVHHHGRIPDPDELTVVSGLTVANPTRTVYDLSAGASIESLMVTASSALRLGLATDLDLADSEGRYAHLRGSRRARLAVRLSDGRAESVGEVRSLHAMWRNGVPRPELQFEIYENGRLIARVDFAWPEFRHLGEFDGLIKYGLIDGGLDARTALISEKQREDAIRSLLWGLSRWIWANIDPRSQRGWASALIVALESSRRQFTKNAHHIALG